jgi:hypothetical protein
MSAILALGVGVVVMLAGSERDSPSHPLDPADTGALRHRVAQACHLDESLMTDPQVGQYSVTWSYVVEGRVSHPSLALFDGGTATCG